MTKYVVFLTNQKDYEHVKQKSVGVTDGMVKTKFLVPWRRGMVCVPIISLLAI